MDFHQRLADVARTLANRPLTSGPDVAFLYEPFLREDGSGFAWCAAFTYHCVVKAGFSLPPRWPGPVRCSFGGVYGWVDWAVLTSRHFRVGDDAGLFPSAGDLVVFDNLLDEGPCDHIGIVLAAEHNELEVSEGNVRGVSGIFRRNLDSKIRCFIRLPVSDASENIDAINWK